MGLQVIARPFQRHARIETEALGKLLCGEVEMAGSDATWKQDDRHLRMRFMDVGSDLAQWRQAEMPHVGVRERAGPGIEELQDFRAGFDLADEVLAGRIHQQSDERGEVGDPSMHPALRRGEVPARSALDHVGGDGPGRAGETDQRGLQRQFLPDPPDRL